MSIYVINLETPLKTVVLGAFITQTAANKYISSYVKENDEFKKAKKNDRNMLYFFDDHFIVLNKVPFSIKKSEKTEKKSLSGYMLFCKDVRDQIKQEHPEFKFSEISKCLGEKWRNLTDEEKKVYNEKSKSQNKEIASDNEFKSDSDSEINTKSKTDTESEVKKTKTIKTDSEVKTKSKKSKTLENKTDNESESKTDSDSEVKTKSKKTQSTKKTKNANTEIKSSPELKKPVNINTNQVFIPDFSDDEE